MTVPGATQSAISGQIVASFPTRRQAKEWIDAQVQIAMKIANASDVP